MAGYTNMLSHIAENGSYKVYILGSAYEKWSSSFSMNERPYYDYREMLARVVNESGKRVIELGAPP